MSANRTFRAALAALALLAAPCPAAKPVARPNIVLIVVDTLRYDHMGQAGYRRPTTPALDALAAEGARFTQAFSTSGWTPSSVMSLFTSLHVAQHGVRGLDTAMPATITTLAAELRRAGYQTAGFTASPLTHGRLGFGRGFDLYDDYTILLGANLLEPGGRPVQPQTTPTAEPLTQLALNWLDTVRKPTRPFLLEVMYFDPHADYLPPTKYAALFTDPNYRGSQSGRQILNLAHKYVSLPDREQITGLYDGEVRYADEYIGVLLDHLRKLGLLDDTVVVVTADHGEELWDHGDVLHGHTLYEETVHIPFIVRYPALVKPGTVITNQVSLIDVMPTLLAATSTRPSPQCRGRNLLALLTGTPGDFTDRPVFMEMHADADLAAARMPGRKLIANLAGAQVSLYDLASDPAEKNDLANTSRREEFSDLLGLYAAWTNSLPRATQSCKVKTDARLLDQLRSLGYAR